MALLIHKHCVQMTFRSYFHEMLLLNEGSNVNIWQILCNAEQL